MRPLGAITARSYWEIALKPRTSTNVSVRCLKQAYRAAASNSSNLKKQRYFDPKSSVKVQCRVGVSRYTKIGKPHVCTFLTLSFSNSIILWELEMIFSPKLDVCMGNAYVKFELNRVYIVLPARLLVRNVLV